ncbi:MULTISPECIES: hypothetical protein [unclassified Bacillus (in: firmicutes)]|nr:MULTISPECIES: hypothetical protein [unclassified Bacillus (in: firmicutes)]PEJ57904.1 hypothetical protein CN692_11330 [Bacillus sp. AFS002410]PEL12525.1 hypothetical protein CN601_07760 [Bacillus sp. AFS017336]
MSHAAGGSKKNRPSDANHVDAKTKAHQKRLSKDQQNPMDLKYPR